MMDPITMMVASVGMQFFNNYVNNKKSQEIQAKQREFQVAAAEHNFERMRKLQAEQAKLALELEAEVHKERVIDINNSYDSLLENFAHSFTIANWPLNVLPFVMKGESFGHLFNGTSKSVNMHCIFTPSNCKWFNEVFYDDIDLRLEAEMNNNWNSQTSHHVVYYGGAWNDRKDVGNGYSIPNEINLNKIDLLKINLHQVPVMVITPYFDPWLHFRVYIWGMGKNSDEPFRIDIPHGNDIEIAQRIFSYDYNKNEKVEDSEDFFNNTIEEFVPYLVSMIGFVADKYFWSMYGISPVLPNYLKQESPINLIGLYRDKYIHSAQSDLSIDGITSIGKLKELFCYIDSVKSLASKRQNKEIQLALLDIIHNTYVPISSETVLPQSYEDISDFIELEQRNADLFDWVDEDELDNDFNKIENIERLDLTVYIDKFKHYVEENSDRFNIQAISLYIKHSNYKTFELRVYNVDEKKFLKVNNGFNYKISTVRPLHFKKTKHIFKNTETGVIICRYSRLDKLKKELLTDDTLIF